MVLAGESSNVSLDASSMVTEGEWIWGDSQRGGEEKDTTVPVSVTNRFNTPKGTGCRRKESEKMKYRKEK